MKFSLPSYYFLKYLQVAPLSHAIWRSCEASALSTQKYAKPVLDIGCGFGEFSGVFFDYQLEVGVDINPQQTSLALVSGKYKSVFTADARSLPFGEMKFNTVISVSVLEHISNPRDVFFEAYRVLKPGGLFIYTVPTKHLYSMLLGVRLLSFLGLNSLAKRYFGLLNRVFAHKFVRTLSTWKSLALRAGFLVREIQGTVSASDIRLWECFLPLAFPSQFIKWKTGKRLVLGGRFRLWLFAWFRLFLKTDLTCMANVLIVAQKPK